MNPDKLFDYLDGRLPSAERAALEDRLISDQQLQRELAVARRIHAGMGDGSREVFLATQADATKRGRKMALRVGAAFIILMAVNVGAGLWIIARHERKNPNRALLEAQTREQIMKSLQHAAATALTPSPSFGVSEITISAGQGRLDAVADEVVALAGRLGGSATKGLPDEHRIGVLVDLPSNRESEFRAAIASVVREGPGSSASANQPSHKATARPEATADKTTPDKVEKKSFVVQIVEAAAKQD
jgi:anti-sigma factor RsiW